MMFYVNFTNGFPSPLFLDYLYHEDYPKDGFVNGRLAKVLKTKYEGKTPSEGEMGFSKRFDSIVYKRKGFLFFNQYPVQKYWKKTGMEEFTGMTLEKFKKEKSLDNS